MKHLQLTDEQYEAVLHALDYFGNDESPIDDPANYEPEDIERIERLQRAAVQPLPEPIEVASDGIILDFGGADVDTLLGAVSNEYTVEITLVDGESFDFTVRGLDNEGLAGHRWGDDTEDTEDAMDTPEIELSWENVHRLYVY